MANNRDHNEMTRSFSALLQGTMVGHYRILEKIGTGGMGEVYLAEDLELRRKVALKFLPHHLCRDQACRNRFKREAQAAAKLDHPNIVPVYEVGEFQGQPYFAMAHIKGQSFRDIIKEGKLDIIEVIDLTMQICEGLHDAHEAGVIHRDVKPSNIILDSKGRPRLLDFGLAVIASGDKLTKTGSTLGTVGYMSPEQVQGKEVDHRSDLFSLGVVMYELITKQNPFMRDNEAATLKAISDDKPQPLARYRAGVPDGLQRIIDKALEKDIKTRYQHADGLLSDLRRVKDLPEAAEVRGSTHPGFTGPGRVGHRIMLAVLPLENLGSPEDEYFSDGMTEEIICRLASVSKLGVISRTSVMGYKRKTKSITEIGRELGVDYILEGTVRYNKKTDPPRIRVSSQLIRTDEDAHVWAEQVDASMEDVFEVQTKIARDIVMALNVRLVEGEPEWLNRVPTCSTEAYRLLLEARYVATLEGRDADDFKKAISLIQQALDLDSSIVVAWAMLSMSHSQIHHFGIDLTPERAALAEAAASKALELDPSSPEAHSAMGWFHYCCERNYDQALTEFEYVRAAPSCLWDPTLNLAYILRRRGSFAEALKTQLERFKLDPRSAKLAWEIGVTYWVMSDFEASLDYCQKAISLAPNKSDFYAGGAYLFLVWKGDLAAARSMLERVPPGVQVSQWFQWIFWHQLICERDLDRAQRYLDDLDTRTLASVFFYWPISLCRALTFRWLGRNAIETSLFKEGRKLLESRLQESPGDYRAEAALGLACGGLGQKADALVHAMRATELCPVQQDAFVGRYLLYSLVHVHLLTEEYDAAVNVINQLLSIGAGNLSVPLLMLDPAYDPLHGHPRFQALLKKYEK